MPAARLQARLHQAALTLGKITGAGAIFTSFHRWRDRLERRVRGGPAPPVEASSDLPCFDAASGILNLPLVGETARWDVMLDDDAGTVLRLAAGHYRLNGAAARRARLGDAPWQVIEERALVSRGAERIEIAKLSAPREPAHVELEVPYRHLKAREAVVFLCLPSEGGAFELAFGPAPRGMAASQLSQVNAIRIPHGLPEGEYTVRARWSPSGPEPTLWSAWSPPLQIIVHPQDANIDDLRAADHRLSLMLERDPAGAVTITDPDALPPACPAEGDRKWFAAPCYEGVTMLVNERPDYYRDPLVYYLACIDALREKGAHFVTWHDLLADRSAKASIEVLLQFDVDGGPRSMIRMLTPLLERGVRATIMTHWRDHGWYEFSPDSDYLQHLKRAERAGWTIGYHNNAVSQVQANDGTADYSPDRMSAAEAAFREDVEQLRRHFDIRTFTHHGGNVLNYRLRAPGDLDDLACVDRWAAPDLWAGIRSMFSDGSFTVRPGPLRERIDGLVPGRHFFRNHPFKYGNYACPPDAPPRAGAELEKLGLDNDAGTHSWIARELDKERRWLAHRRRNRSTRRLSYPRLDKPISARFRPFAEIAPDIEALRQQRRSSFIRLYPWPQGDPRVFWWRMIEAWAPRGGRVLNVGALPPDQRNETARFLGSETDVIEMDIDGGREPDLLMDIVDAPEALHGSFDAVLLFGLPYFARPGDTVDMCARLVRPSGVGLFGFAADTNRSRGSVWHPRHRHLWRREREPLDHLGLKGNLWAFDGDGLPDLFRAWPDVLTEFMGDYWFVVGKRPDG